MPGAARDFVGYGARPPKPAWPGGARLALNFVLNCEEGSEPSIVDGDGFSESRLTEVAHSPVPRGVRDLAAESVFEYGARVGFWRLARLFDERGLPFTLFACALALERNPAVAGAVREGGQFFEILRDAVDFLRDEGKTAPRMMSVGLHLRLAGHPARATGLARLLDHVSACGDVWITTRGAIARHWVRQHPPRSA